MLSRCPCSPKIDEDMDGLPGEELIRKGLADLARGEETVESLRCRLAGWTC